MTWLAEWRALAARIEGLATAGADLMQGLAVQKIDPLSVVNAVVRSSADRLCGDLKIFRDRHRAVLPPPTVPILDGFLGRFAGFLARSEQPGTEHAVLQVLAAMRGLRAELDYYFADTDIAARRIVERAFLHLQRSLAADEEVRRRWKDAGDEVACEKFGALHLLAHGVWAFKADAIGARTDLILGRHLSEDEPRASDVEAFVLTEWKVASGGPANVIRKVDEAHTQLRLYRRGALAGFELSSRRYVVLVADQHLDLPDDHDEGGALCRHVLLNRGGETPSVAGRGRGRSLREGSGAQAK